MCSGKCVRCGEGIAANITWDSVIKCGVFECNVFGCYLLMAYAKV